MSPLANPPKLVKSLYCPFDDTQPKIPFSVRFQKTSRASFNHLLGLLTGYSCCEELKHCFVGWILDDCAEVSTPRELLEQCDGTTEGVEAPQLPKGLAQRTRGFGHLLKASLRPDLMTVDPRSTNAPLQLNGLPKFLIPGSVRHDGRQRGICRSLPLASDDPASDGDLAFEADFSLKWSSLG